MSMSRSNNNLMIGVLHVGKKWLKYSVWTVWAFALMIIFGSGGWAFPDGSNPTCIPGDTSHNSSMCGVVEVLLRGDGSLRFLMAFTLAGFLMSSRNLWLVRRSAYCALCGSTRNLLINVTTLAPAKDHKLLARWALLGYELSVLKARSLVDSDEGKEYLLLSKLIAGDEWDSMVDGDRHTTVWYWIQSKAKLLKDRGDIDSFELQTICNAVTLSRDKANDLMSCIDRDQPLPYVFVCAILINATLVITATTHGFVWAKWMNEAGGMGIFAEPRLYCDLILLYVFTTIFAMLFDVCSLLHNPFGARPFDIRHDIVGSGIRQLGIRLSNNGGSVPSSIEEEDHVSFNENKIELALAERNLAKNMPGKNGTKTLLPARPYRRGVTAAGPNLDLGQTHSESV